MLVLFVCPNPALDRVAFASGARRGATVRARWAGDEAGGKALHAARVAASLGTRVEVVAPLGGGTGEAVAGKLCASGIPLAAVTIGAATRRTYTVVDDVAGDVMEVIEPSPRLTAGEARRLREVVGAACRRAGIIVAAGSLPDGVDGGFYRWLVDVAHAAGAAALLDVASDALAAALPANPDLVTPNAGEVQDLQGRDSPVQPFAAAEELCRRGARAALVTAGPEGAALSCGGANRWMYSAPARRVVNRVGCGDAVVGGVAAGLAGGMDLVDAIVLGMAAAADKLGRVEGGVVDRASVEAARAEVGVLRFPAASP